MTEVGHAPPFPDSSPPSGERIKERGTRRASAVEGRAGAHPEARGGASGPPHPSLSPQGERERRTRTTREWQKRGAHPVFLIPLPRRGRGSRRGGAHPEARGGASGPPSPSPLPPRGEGKKNAHHAGMTKAGRAPPFPDSSPPSGERIKERGGAPRGSRWRQQPPSPSPLPPRGEGKKNAHRARG